MRLNCAVGLTVLAIAATAACGGGAEKKQAEAVRGAQEAQKGAERVADSAQDMAKGLDSLAKGLQQMAGGGDTKAVEPVSFRELQPVFPELAGWERGKPTGEKMSSPVSFSQAQVKYTRGHSTIDAKIVDSGFNQILMAPFAMFLTAGYEKETEHGYEKSVSVASYPGWEKWDSEGKDGELNALVNKRFLLTLEGNGLDDTKILHELAGRADLGRLAAVK